MSGIDQDALRMKVDRALRSFYAPWAPQADGSIPDADAVLDAIFPTIEQAIRDAEQRSREQGRRDVLRVDYDDWIAALRSIREGRLARGGSTDEEQGVSRLGLPIPEREPNGADGVRASFQAADEKYAATERECEQLRALLKQVRDEIDKANSEGRFGIWTVARLIDSSGLLDGGDKGQA